MEMKETQTPDLESNFQTKKVSSLCVLRVCSPCVLCVCVCSLCVLGVCLCVFSSLCVVLSVSSL